MPDDSAGFGDGIFGGPLFAGEGTVTPEPAAAVGLYGKVSLEDIPYGDVSLEEIPQGEVSW